MVLQENKEICTGREVKAPTVQHSISRDVITTKTETGKLRNIHGIKSRKTHSRKAVFRAIGIKEMRLKNKKYTVARSNGDNFVAESVQTVTMAAATASQAGGILKTAVKNTSSAAGHIATAVKSKRIFTRKSSVKDFGRIATGVGGGIKNIAKDTGAQLLRTKIDKSTVTDTGMETLKQGATELRYLNNARKAVLNTARTTVKAGYAVKNMPKNTRIQTRQIKKTTKKTVDAAKKVGAVLKKILTSKVGMFVLLSIVGILLLIVLLTGIISAICGMVSGLFAWLAPDGGDTSTETLKNNVSTYISQIQECETTIQAEIDAIINGMEPEYRYDGSQINGLNQFGNSDLQITDYNAVLAVLATQKYKTVKENGTDNFSFTDEEIRNAVEMFYSFTYRYEYDYCPDWDCSLDEDCLLSLSSGSFYLSDLSYNGYGDYYEVTLQGPTYEHASGMFTQIEIYMLEGGTIGGSGYADVGGGIWTMTYNIGSEAYSQIDWDNFYLTVDTIYCNDSNHCYLYGDVINYVLETVMQKCGFTDEERSVYEVYYEQITILTGG